MKFRELDTNSADDVHELLKIRNDEGVRRNLIHNSKISLEQHLFWVDSVYIGNDSIKIWLIEDIVGVDIIGYIDFKLNYQLKMVEIGYKIKSEFQGQGKGKAAVIWSLKHVKKVYKAYKPYLTVLENNDIAIALYKKYGFRINEKLKSQMFPVGSDYKNRYYKLLYMSLGVDDG